MIHASDLADIAAEKLRRLAREQDAFAAMDQGKLSLPTYARLREGLAASRGEAAAALAKLYAAMSGGDVVDGVIHQLHTLTSDKPIPSATLRDEWAAGWLAYASRTAAEADALRASFNGTEPPDAD